MPELSVATFGFKKPNTTERPIETNKDMSVLWGKTDSKLKNQLPQTATVSFSRLLYESGGTWFSEQRQSGTEPVSDLNPRSCFLGHW